jgi:pyruvate dehydrogenase E2 component (dihydrolipoamide acetyltransferase)
MARGAQIALPAILETSVDWKAIAAARDITRAQNGPTGFAMLLWCVADAMKEHAAFRSTLSTDGKTLRTYHHVNLGVAVSLPGDRLITAVVRDADTLSKDEFFTALSQRISEAREGKDQVDGTTTVSVSNNGTAGMRSGIPVVVTPAVATIAIGEIRDEPIPTDDGFAFRKVASLTMSFDHRLMNGVGAANFLNAVRERAAEFSL